jgi:ubiquitin-like domain-containing CTD phosphatase 1
VQLDVSHRPENLAKLARRVAQQACTPLQPPRPGKKLLVLDIDYTLFDHRSTAETPQELARPHLHAFLTAAYACYGARMLAVCCLRACLARIPSADMPSFSQTS